jgi:hypothetical protein
MLLFYVVLYFNIISLKIESAYIFTTYEKFLQYIN